MNSFDIGAQEAMTKGAYLPGTSHWKMRKAVNKDKARKIRVKSGPKPTRGTTTVSVRTPARAVRGAKKGLALGLAVGAGAAVAHATRKKTQDPAHHEHENPEPRYS